MGQGLTYGLQLALIVVAARMLGPAGQGAFAILRTSVFLGEALLWLGLNSSLTYLVARDEAKYHDPLLKVSLGYLVVAVLGVAVITQSLAAHHGRSAAFDVILDNRVIFVLWLTVLALLQLIQKTILGQRRFSVYNRVCIINAAAAFPLLLALGFRWGVSVAVVAQASICGSVIALAYALWAQRGRLFAMRWSTTDLFPVVMEAYGVGLKGYVSTIAFLVLYRLDFFFVASFLGPGALGIYTVAVFVIEAVQKVPDWLGMMLAPQVAAGRDTNGRTTRRYAAGGLAVVGIAAVVLGALGHWERGLFRLALGTGYEGVEAILVLLLPRAALHSVMVTFAGYLAGRGYTLYHPLAGVSGLVILCAVDLLTVPHYGLQGAVMGITVAYLVATAVILLGYRAQRRVEIVAFRPERGFGTASGGGSSA